MDNTTLPFNLNQFIGLKRESLINYQLRLWLQPDPRMGLITGMGLNTWPPEVKITRVGAKIPQENLAPGGQAARRYFSPRGQAAQRSR